MQLRFPVNVQDQDGITTTLGIVIEETDDEGFVVRIPGLNLDSQASNVLGALNQVASQYAKSKGGKGPVTVWRPSVPGQVCKALTLEKGLSDLFEEFLVLNCEKSFAQLVMESQPSG
jgi:hypothetical protein